VAYDAICEITGPNGKRLVSIHDFYKGVGKVDLVPGELLTGILIPKESYENCFGYYIKYAMRNAMDIATIGCSVNVVLSADKKSFQRVVSPTACWARFQCGKKREAALNGQPVSLATVELAERKCLRM
jgi:xanthine dehydrogenase FAD-binding subunit